MRLWEVELKATPILERDGLLAEAEEWKGILSSIEGKDDTGD